jgi:uncharacterized membrane protein
MKALAIIGVVLVLLGVLSFIVPIPHQQDHSVKIGDSKVGIQTQTSEKIPVAAGVALIGVGVVALALGSRRS